MSRVSCVLSMKAMVLVRLRHHVEWEIERTKDHEKWRDRLEYDMIGPTMQLLESLTTVTEAQAMRTSCCLAA